MTDQVQMRGNRRRNRRFQERALGLACTVMLGAAMLGRLASPPDPRRDDAAGLETAALPPLRLVAVVPDDHGWLFDPSPILGAGAVGLRSSAITPPNVASAARESTPAGLPRIAEPARQTMAQLSTPLPQAVPLPMPRPGDFTRTPRESVRLAARSAVSRVPRSRGPVTPRPDAQAEKSFFETVFGTHESNETVLAYAPLNSGAIEAGPSRLTGPSARPEGATAVYNITTRTVTLPNGEQLEAHSGLGAAMDNPKLVHLRMRGSTPPGIYDLTEREALFHGVRAIRLNPIGGSAAIHGRDGILAHTYMLGPKGASNGCVSFRNYDRFLQAYLRGDVRRLVVVAGSSGDSLPSIAQRALKRLAGAE